MRGIVAVLIFAVVLALPASVFAECAWVLWTVHATIDPNANWETAVRINPANWQPSHAFDTARSCNSEKTALDLEESKARRERNRAGIWEAWAYRCLPDTIDPRGPKGR